MGDIVYYVKRNEDGIYLKTESASTNLNIGLKNYLNSLCLKNMSTYDGRRTAAVKLLRQKSNIPIYINKELIVYPTKPIREYDTVFVNFFAVLSIKSLSKKATLFTFANLEELIVEISIQKILKQHKRIKIINKYLANQVLL